MGGYLHCRSRMLHTATSDVHFYVPRLHWWQPWLPGATPCRQTQRANPVTRKLTCKHTQSPLRMATLTSASATGPWP